MTTHPSLLRVARANLNISQQRNSTPHCRHCSGMAAVTDCWHAQFSALSLTRPACSFSRFEREKLRRIVARLICRPSSSIFVTSTASIHPPPSPLTSSSSHPSRSPLLLSLQTRTPGVQCSCLSRSTTFGNPPARSLPRSAKVGKLGMKATENAAKFYTPNARRDSHNISGVAHLALQHKPSGPAPVFDQKPFGVILERYQLLGRGHKSSLSRLPTFAVQQ